MKGIMSTWRLRGTVDLRALGWRFIVQRYRNTPPQRLGWIYDWYGIHVWYGRYGVYLLHNGAKGAA